MTAPVSKVPNGPGFEIVKVPPASFIGSETLRPCSLRDVAYRMRELVQVEEFGASNYGDDETLVVDVDRNPEIYVEMNDEFIVTNRRVESRKVAKRFDGRNRVEGR